MPVVFANDLLLFLCIQLAFWVVGLPLIYLLPRQQISGRCLAAPIFGCTFLGIATTILYQCGVPSAVSTFMLVAGATAASISILAHVATTRWPPALSSIVRSGGLVGITLVVSFLCILPKWTGGEQFAVFQGNGWDHFRYLSATVAFAHHSYDYLLNVHVHAPEAGYVWDASTMLSNRPTVSILYAGFSNRFQPAVFGGYVYLAALQLNLFFAAAFTFRNLLTADSRVSYALGGALCIGFFTQYVVDINAWSQLAAMPIVLVAFALVVLLLDAQCVPDPLGGRVRFTQCCRLAFATGIPGAGLLYFYPEIIPVYAPVFATAVFAKIWPGGHRVTGRRVCSIGAGAVLAALLGVLSWEATLHFLWRQMRFGVTADVDWWRYFQRYLLPADLDSCSCSAYALFSAPIDFALGAVGLYFLSPGPGWSLGLRVAWKGLLCIALVWLLAASVRAVWRTWRDRRDGTLAVAYWSGTASLIVPGALALKEHYWAAGKGLSMVSPLLFMLLVAPIVASRCGRSWWRVPAIVLVAGHVAFGLYRPVAAASPTGIHYASPRYPSGQVPQWKEDIRWNLQSWVPTLLSCERVSIDSDNYFVERYVQLLLEDLKLRSSSTLDITTQLGSGVTLGTPKQLPNPDCVITTMARPGREGARIIWLLKNVDVLEFLQGGRQSVELAVSRSGVVVRGASEVEVTPRGPLRWTMGDAHFILPNDPARPARRLMVGVWDVRAPRVGAMEVLVNRRSLFAGPLPEGEWAQAFSLEHVDSVAQLDVQIRSATGRFSGDPRPLGIALREVRVSR